MKLMSFQQPVTTDELSSFISYISKLEPDEDNIQNKWAQGTSGEAVKAIATVYSLSRCVTVLNHMIRFCDKLLTIRNDVAAEPVGQHAIWTGNVEAVWPNDTSTDVIGTGGEQGDVAGHLTHCARFIIEKSSILDQEIEDGDPNGFGKTYKERADRYISEAEKTVHHILEDLLDLSNDDRLYFSDKGPYKPGEPVPWNQIMMLCYPLQHLIFVYEITGNNLDKAEEYRRIIKRNMRWFFEEGAELYTSEKGSECYRWKYQFNRRTFEDSNHANLDIEGFYRIYLDDLGVTKEEMTRLANTFVDVMIRDDGNYAGRVTGTSDEKKGASTSYVRPGFLLLSEFRTDAFDRIVSADVKVGRSSTRFKHVSRILWLKHRRHKSGDSREDVSRSDGDSSESAVHCICGKESK